MAQSAGRDDTDDARTLPRVRARRIWLAGVAGLACVPLLLLAMSPQVLRGTNIVEQGDVINVYYKTALRVRNGEVPYRDFLLEYPILSVPFVLLPALAGTSRIGYEAAFVFEALVINAFLIQLVARAVARQEGEDKVIPRLVWYCALFTPLSRMIVSRIDLGPTLVAFWATGLWLEGKTVRGGALAAVGALMKIFPGFVALPCALWEASSPGGKRYRGFATFVIVSTLGMAAWLAIGGKGAIGSLTYHGERGLEIGSLYSGVLMGFGGLTRGRYSVPFDHGSFNVVGPGSVALAKLSGLLQIILVGITLLRFAGAGFRDGNRYTLAVLLATISAAKLLSPQYYIWLLPFVVVVGGRVGGRARLLYGVICLLTLIIYPPMFDPLIEFHPGAVFLLNLRNALGLALWGLLTFGGEEQGPPGHTERQIPKANDP